LSSALKDLCQSVIETTNAVHFTIFSFPAKLNIPLYCIKSYLTITDFILFSQGCCELSEYILPDPEKKKREEKG
jgi:hypothetical protein